MISVEALAEAATKYRTNVLNIVREYVQHLFLNYLYKKPDSRNLLFKGGTALRIVYKSPRFSEDLDFSSYGLTTDQIERIFFSTLDDLEKLGMSVELHERSHETSGGYYGEAKVGLRGFEIRLEINVNDRPGEHVRGEYKLIAGDFAPNYGLLMLPEKQLVEEKIAALMSRQKPRDFYDLYFMLRSSLVPLELKPKLREVLPILEDSRIDFRQELGVFLPQDYQQVIRDFKATLLSEIRRHVGSV